MSIWDEKNAAAGGQTPGSSSRKGNAWERANSAIVSPVAGLPQYMPQAQIIEQNRQTVQERAIAERESGMRPGPTIERANQQPFLRDTVISAPAPRERGLGLQDITISRPTGIYSTDTGLPIIDIGENPQITTGPKTGFLGKMFAGAANVALGAITGISNALGDIYDVVMLNTVVDGKEVVLGEGGFAYYKDNPPIGVENGKSTGKPVPILYPGLSDRLKAGLPAAPTGAEEVAAGLNLVTAGASAAFAPVSAELAAAEELPVIGKPIFGTISKGFELLDHASRWVGGGIVDALPVSDETRAVLRQPIEDLAGIVGTLVGVKAIHVAGERGGGRVVESLPVKDSTKANINRAVQTTAAFSLQPFTSAYRGIIGSIKTKTETRQAAGEEITPEVAKVIVNQAVKENVMPDIPSLMEIPTANGKVERLYTNQKLVLQNLIRGRENLNYRVVDDLGISLNTGKPITSRFEWDYKNQRGTIYTTNKAQSVDLARELGHYVDRQLGAGLSTRLSDVLPEYRTKRDEVNQMLADYALDRLGGNATHAEINAEVLRIADGIRTEIEASIGRTLEKAKAKDFADTFGGVIDSVEARAASPELAQLARFVLGDVARKGGKPDIEGAPGSKQETASALTALERAKREQVKDTRENNQAFREAEARRQIAREAVAEQGDVASANFPWRDTVKAIRDSKEFKKEGSISDATINGVLMTKNGKYRLVPHSEVRKMQQNGWESRMTMDEIAHANGFENAETYAFYVMELDAQSRSISRSSEQRAAHEFLMKNDPNYAKLNETIEVLREQLTSAEDAVRRQEPASEGDARRVLAEGEARQGESVEVAEAPKTTAEAPIAERTTEVPQTAETRRIERLADAGEGPRGSSKVGESIARKTIEQKLEDSYGETAGYDKITIADQARRVEELLTTDIERARRVLSGQEALPEGMRGSALIKGMEEYALKTGDAELAFELANSPLVAETSIFAQEMRILAERTPDSATAQLRSIKKAREEAAQEALQRGQTLFDVTKKAKNELREAVEKSRPTKETWSSFIDSIKCS